MLHHKDAASMSQLFLKFQLLVFLSTFFLLHEKTTPPVSSKLKEKEKVKEVIFKK